MMAFGWFAARRAPRGLPDGPLRRYLEAPPPHPGAPPDELRLLAIDLETTGLNPANDVLLSTGYVPIEGLAVDLSGAGGSIVRVATEVGQSAVFHGLTDDQLARGRPLAEVVDDVLDALTGRVLLAHHATVEQSFLARAIEQVHGVRVRFESLDTMKLTSALIAPGFDDEPRGEDLRLWRARGRYGLPRYRSHDALTDAIACAELFLAQVAEIGSDTPYKKLKRMAG
ncbi:MAG: exonuclease domain-containing protein [Propionibacteriaceae bacterium]|nr:exonuclease domain-containing protein [Propionibacteriaceae bacterium]